MVGLMISSIARATEVSPLSSYSEVDRLWMGMEEGGIRPATFEQIRSESPGYIAIHVEDGAILKKGDHWATIDPEQLDIERRAFEVDKQKLDKQLETAIEEAQDLHTRAELDLHEALRKIDDLQDVRDDPDLPIALKERVDGAITEISERLGTMRAKLDPETLETEIELLKEDHQIQLARKDTQLQALIKRSNLVATVGGALRLGPDLVRENAEAADDKSKIWVQNGQLIATIVDESHYVLSITASGSQITSIPVEELRVLLQDTRTGRLIASEFVRIEEVDQGREIVRNYIFHIQGEGLEAARQAQGMRHLVHIYRGFPQKYRLVHKKDIAFLAPDVLESSGWTGLVRHLWPESSVVQVGPQTIAVDPGNAN